MSYETRGGRIAGERCSPLLFAAVLVGKIDSKNELEKQVTEETFVSVLTSNILSLINAIASIILLNINEDSECVRNLVSAIIYSISFITIMLLLMITKRTFIIYCDKKKK